MKILLLAFVIGVVSGLRSLMGIAVVSWGARMQRLPLEGTWLAFLGYAATPWVLTVLAMGELVVDKLPKTPSRTMPPSFIIRVVMGSVCGAAIGVQGQMMIAGLIAGAVGSVAGTLGGAKARGALARMLGNDLPAALIEDAVAVGLAVLVVFAAGH